MMDYATWNVMRSRRSRSCKFLRSSTGCRIRKSCFSSYYGFQLFYLSLLLSCFGVWLASSSLVADATSTGQSLGGSINGKMTIMTLMMRRKMMSSTAYRQGSGSTKRLLAFATPKSRSSTSSCVGYYACHDQSRGNTGSTRQLGTTGHSLLFMSTTQNNNDIIKEQLRIAREKKETKQRYLEMDRQRNLNLKRMLHSSTSSSSSSNIMNETSMTGPALENEETSSSSSTAEDSSFVVPPMYAIKVSVDSYLREEFHMSGREKRGRMFIPFHVDKSLNGLKREIHSFFRCLTKSSYQLSAALPQITYSDQHIDSSTGGPLPQVVAPPVMDNISNNMTLTYDSDNHNYYWSIESDEDVQRSFENARQYFESQNETTQLILKRPTLILHVSRHPEYSPPPTPFYLKDMPNPQDSSTMSMISFYSFPPQGIEDPTTFAQTLSKLWKKPFGALGRVYVAHEGINAQMSIPTNVLTNFEQCCCSIPELGEYIENGINIDPVPIPMKEFATAGADGKNPPFKNLHVRVRNQIVADGLLDSDRTLNFQSAGYDMPPLEWHAKLKEAKDARRRLLKEDDANSNSSANNPNIPVILDCRNQYETGVGQFEGAEPVNTENFRDTWDVLQTRLKDVPKDAPIMTYCTGGIRCVKVGAYLTQEMGFTNVSRLAGGIIAYDRTIQNLNYTGTTIAASGSTTITEESNVNEREIQPVGGVVEESMFKGTNYVFDGRVGRQITNDLMGTCLTCGNSTNLLTNCQNKNCHQRMVQCATCKDTFLGACSYACKGRVEQTTAAAQQYSPVDVAGESSKETFFTRTPDRTDESSVTETGSSVDENDHPSKKEITTLDDYCEVYSSASSTSLLDTVEENTKRLIPTGSHMVSGKLQGQLLKNLASMTTHGRILEIGTFTGYATLCFMEGSYQAAKTAAASATNQESSSRRKPFVMSLERDPRALQVAAAHLTIASTEGIGTSAANVANELSNDQLPSFDEDVLEVTYKDTVPCQLRKVTDALATLEEFDKHLSTSMSTEESDNEFQLVPQQLLLDGPFDMVFVDADKTRLSEYADLLLKSDTLLKPGGFIVVDNVLWKGRVLDHVTTTKKIQEDIDDDNQFGISNSSISEDDDNSSDDGTSSKSAYALKKKAKRARRLALLMHKFNQYISNDPRAEVMIVPIRDGLSIIRKKIVQ